MTNLQTKSARAALAPRGKPYKHSLTRGLTIGYRKPLTGAGSWVAIVADSSGGQWTDTFAQADDMAPADGTNVLTYREACDRADKLAQGRNSSVVVATPPVSIDEALANYAIDLASRGGAVANATHVRYHLSQHFLPKLLSQVTTRQLSDWRFGLLKGGMNPATLNRLLKSVHACFNREARLDDRVAANASAWKRGLEFVPNANRARNAILEPAQVKALVAAAYDVDEAFGLYVQAHAELGSRSDMIARITCGDVEPTRVMVPNSGKGRGKHKSTSGSTSVPVVGDLAHQLIAKAAGRPADALLLTGPDGRSWTATDHARRMFRKAVAAAEVPPGTTLIAFRHSSIVRALQAGINCQTVADWHNTSTRMIETNYARFMRDRHDDIIRRALMETGPRCNVVSLTG